MKKFLKAGIAVIVTAVLLKVTGMFPESEWSLYARVILVMAASVAVTLTMLGGHGKADEEETQDKNW